MGLIFLGDASGKDGLLLCISITLILVLLWYISRQEYRTSCDRRISDLNYQMHWQMHMNRGDDPFPRADAITATVSPFVAAVDKQARAKKVLAPERDILLEHALGDRLDRMQNKVDDPLTLDGLMQTAVETTAQIIARNKATGSIDGPQLEGMATPDEAFQRDAMIRQLNKRQEVYGFQDYQPTEADRLSELNR